MGNTKRDIISPITRVVCTRDGVTAPSDMIDLAELPPVVFRDTNQNEPVRFQLANGETVVQSGWKLTERDICRLTDDGADIVTKKTVDGERSFVKGAKAQKIASAYTGSISFKIRSDEAIYGLGQQENGILNYRDAKEYLYQNNMKISMPVFVSSRKYAILFDAKCFMVYEEKDTVITVHFDAVDQIDYYMIAADSFRDVVRNIRALTGKAPMLPRWFYGYVQSKERYKTQDEILGTVKEFKARGIPLSCIVLDWCYWEEGKWGNKHVDTARFPDLPGMMRGLHENDVAMIVSVWPNMNAGCENHTELLEAGKLLSNRSTYDAFDRRARKMYWKQCEEELFSAGVDGWWCDSTEPFTPDWEGSIRKTDAERYEITREESAKYLDARLACGYALAHARGMYHHQKKAAPDRRVLNLTRSGSPSIQKYGAVLWSGDIAASWDVLKKQVVEGLHMGISGIPYWTLDIGAFFVGSQRAWQRWSGAEEGTRPWFWDGLFEGGVSDMGYRELYVRWLQLGTFLPVMRSHGTDTPREPWQFGEKGTKYYDTIVKYIKLRYRLLPYIYSLAHGVTRENETIMRHLMFDFEDDPQVRMIGDQFMFGESFLVCPVLTPMEYGPDNQKLDNPRIRKLYLPAESAWYDFETGECIPGGQYVTVDAPIEKLPLFVKAGAVIPMADGYDGALRSVHVYEGQNAPFRYYTDDGTEDADVHGAYTSFMLRWDDGQSLLAISAAEGKMQWPGCFDIILHRMDGRTVVSSIAYEGKSMEIPIA